MLGDRHVDRHSRHMKRGKLGEVERTERRPDLIRVLDVVEELGEVHGPLLPAPLCRPGSDDGMHRIGSAAEGIRGRRVRKNLYGRNAHSFRFLTVILRCM